MLKKAKVLYYLNDKSYFNQRGLAEYIKNSDLKFVSKEEESINHFVSYLPAGTIFAQSYGIEEKSNIICLPLISSHFSLPLKQGEFVWYLSDDDSKKARNNSQEIFNNHPMFSLNDYWISRIHGSLLSEDVNYSFKERDRLVLDKKITSENIGEKNVNSAILPSFESESIFISNEDDTQLKSTKDLYEQGIGNYFGDKAVPRMFSKTDDLTIQGSYNTLINLTSSDSDYSQTDSKEGLIDIVAGRLSLQDFIVKNDAKVKIKKTIKNLINTENINKEKEINLSLEKFLSIENTSGGEELFKKPNLYLNEDINSFNSIEDKVSYESDASRLLISESENIDSGFYSTDFLSKTKNFESDFIEFESINSNEELVSVPSIFLKTNNIRIISRKELNNEEITIPAGNIRLIKEDDNFLNYSQILMESNGDVFIDGNTIKIGDFRKELMKFNDIEKLKDIEKIKINPNDEKIKNMNGKGFGVLLGYEENLSEPLVLGDTLVAILSEIININISTLNEVLSVTDQQKADNQAISNFATLIDTQLKTLGAPGATLAFNSGANYDSIIDNASKEIRRLEDIKKNLTDILSRFSKTS